MIQECENVEETEDEKTRAGIAFDSGSCVRRKYFAGICRDNGADTGDDRYKNRHDNLTCQICAGTVRDLKDEEWQSGHCRPYPAGRSGAK